MKRKIKAIFKTYIYSTSMNGIQMPDILYHIFEKL